MNWQKLDAALAAAVSKRKDDSFSVFIRLNPQLDNDDLRFLVRLGITGISTIATANLSIRSIEELSDMPLVQSISLTKRFRPLQNPDRDWWPQNRPFVS